MVVSVALFLIPVIVAMAAAAVLVRVIPKPRSDFTLGAWWALVIIAPWVVRSISVATPIWPRILVLGR